LGIGRREGKEGSISFLKKRNKKLLIIGEVLNRRAERHALATK
jgi:hypothetical protein